MKRLLFCLVLLASPLEAPAQRAFNQAELDALLAPVALYPDALLRQVLIASTRPYDVEQAARWQPGTPPQTWNPAVEALLQYPDLLARMGENPQWVRDLADAWLGNERLVMDTVQQLRARAEATGYLRSNDRQQVTRQGDNIVVQPVYQQQTVYVPYYYNPLIVYGAWWWATYRPLVWRPWYRHSYQHRYQQPRPVVVYRAVPQHPHRPVNHVVQNNGAPSPAVRMQRVQTAAYVERQRIVAQPSPAAVANRGQSPVIRGYARSVPSQGR